MRILILGGGRFLGRHLAADALARGHDVTLFNRGRSASPALFPRATWIHGDRDTNAGLDALLAGAPRADAAGRSWDAVIDTCAYLPRQVRAAAARLQGRVGIYHLVSSISVYADLETPGADEDAPRQVLADPDVQTVDAASYGGLKALCEDAALAAYGADACLVSRPGLLVGPHDPTGRFGWWVQRFERARCDDAAAGEVLAPGDPATPVQWIDARDAAAWMLDQAEAGATGVCNLAGPTAAPATIGSMLHTLRATLAPQARLCWVDEAWLLERGVQPWTDLPVWLPTAQAAMHRIDAARARARGLACRPLAQTIADIAASTASPPSGRDATPAKAGPPRAAVGLAPEREAALLAAWHTRTTPTEETPRWDT